MKLLVVKLFLSLPPSRSLLVQVNLEAAKNNVNNVTATPSPHCLFLLLGTWLAGVVETVANKLILAETLKL